MNLQFKICLLFLYLFMGVSCKVDEDNEVVSKSEVPDLLVGTWLDQDSYFFQQAFDPLLYNATSNVWYRGYDSPWDIDPDPGRGLQLNKNGRFIWTLVHDTGVGGCRTTAASYLKGTVEVDEEKITFYPSIRRAKLKSVCNPGLNYDRDESKEKFTIVCEIEQQKDSWGNEITVLKLINPDGTYSLFYKHL